MKKYEFTGKTMQYEGCTLHQIRALRDLCIHSTDLYIEDINIRKGDVGGWIESKGILSHEGNCWVDHNAKVYGHASIKDNAYVGGKAIVCCSTIAENARVCDSAVVKSHSKIYGNAVIVKKAQIYYSEIYGSAEITGTAKMCFQKIYRGLYFESKFGYKKYEFTGKTIEYEGYTLYQIRALRDLFISSNRSENDSVYVNVGDIGGWICSEDALSHEGNCWVDHNAKIYGSCPSIEDNAYVGNEATVCGATISGRARVVGNADVKGFTKIFGNALIGESALVKGRSKIYGNATIMGRAKVANSDISGSTTITGTIEVNCKTLCKGLYDCEDDFCEKRPEKRNYEKPFLPVDNSLSYYERMADARRRNAWRTGHFEDLLWDDL